MDFSRQQLDELLYKAYLDARLNERNSEAQLEFEFNLESNLRDLREELYNKTYKVGPSYCFVIKYPALREVFAPSFRDRIVSHFVYNILYPMVDPLFIYDSYACRIGKGTLFGIKRFHHLLRSCTNNFTKKAYVLSLDISGYFMNINKNILEKITLDMINSRKYKIDTDYSLLEYLVSTIIQNDVRIGCERKGNISNWDKLPKRKSLFTQPEYKGLPIGALTSQLFSNIYLNVVDQYAKRTLKCKYYCRYVDDIRIISTNKHELEIIKNNIQEFLKKLDLELNLNKTTIISSYKRQQFLGAVSICSRVYAIKKTLQNFRKRISSINYLLKPSKIQSILNSFLGYLSYFRTSNVVISVIKHSLLPQIFYFYKNKAILKYMEIKTAIWGWYPPKYELLSNNTFKIYFNPVEETQTRTHIDPKTNEETSEDVRVYRVNYIEKEYPELLQAITDKNDLLTSKLLLLERINAYDQSENVNSFVVNDEQVWLDKATRVGLMNSVTIEKNSGKANSIIWLNNKGITVDCTTLIEMLNSLELYALACYNKTEEHKSNVEKLTDVSQLDNYDYTQDYPEKLEFTL